VWGLAARAVAAAEVAAGGAPKSGIRECALLLMAVAVWAEPALAPQLPKLHNKKSCYRRRAEWKYFVEHRREFGLLD